MSVSDEDTKNAKLAIISSSILELEKEEYEAKLGLIQASSISDERKISIMTASIKDAKERIDYLEKQYKAVELE